MTPERKQRIDSVLFRRQPDLTIILENVFDPRNVSAVMRSCDAVGVQEIYILNSKVPTPKSWGFNSSSSAEKWLTVHQFDDTEGCVTALRKKYNLILTTHLGAGSVSLFDLDLTRSCALVFGNEQSGVSEELQVLGDGNFVIPQMGMIQSLNISVACAVALYEAFRQKQSAGHYDQPKLGADEYSRLCQQWSSKNRNDH